MDEIVQRGCELCMLSTAGQVVTHLTQRVLLQVKHATD